MICCNSSVVYDTSSLLHTAPLEELLNGCERWCPLNPGLWTKTAYPIQIMILVRCYLSADTWQIGYQLNCMCNIYIYHYTTPVQVQGNGGLLETDVSIQTVAYPGILFGGGSTNSVEDRENRDLEAVAP